MRAIDRRSGVQQETRHHVTSSAPPLIETLAGVILTLHWPSVISIASELIVIFLPSLVSMVTPPAGPGRSFSVSVALSVLKTFFCAIPMSAGRSPSSQKQPLQIG